jgi:hypothetical protein
MEEGKKDTDTSKKETFLQGDRINELIGLFREINPMYSDLYKNATERRAIDDMARSWGEEKLRLTLLELPKIIGKPFAPRITRPTELRRDIGKLIAYHMQEKSKHKKLIV